jgi:DNA topoisomerase-1
VQIGTKDDEEKPRFAGLRPGQKMDTITLADAMELFKLPRTLGETAEGETIIANVGRFGPYLKYGNKYASLKEDDPYTVTLERACEVIRLKKEADANRLIQDFPDAGIQVLNGRYGPYITDKKKNAAAPERGARFGRFRRGQRAAGGAAATAAAASSSGGDGAQAAAASRAPAPRKGARKKTPPPGAKAEAATNQPPAGGARARFKASVHAGRKPRRRAKVAPRKTAAGKTRAKTSGVSPRRARGVK